MTRTLLECGACGWRAADFATDAEAGAAGLAHLAATHANISPPGAGADQIRMFVYITLAEYLAARPPLSGGYRDGQPTTAKRERKRGPQLPAPLAGDEAQQQQQGGEQGQSDKADFSHNAAPSEPPARRRFAESDSQRKPPRGQAGKKPRRKQ